MKSLKGCFLVASPHMEDPNFARAVVLMIQHGTDGALGLVLNRSIDKTVQELWQEIDEPPCENRQRIHLGGPVSGPLMALHTVRKLGEWEVVPGVFFSAEREHLESLVRRSDAQFRLFVGHSGWGEGQLEGELEQGAWLTTPASLKYVFLDEEQLWPQVTRQIGSAILLSIVKPKHVPDDVSEN